MRKNPSSGRSRPLAPPPPPPPPHGGSTPTPSPLSDSEPDPEVFDPNRTPPPPVGNIFHENIPEVKMFEIPPLRSVPTRRRPLTGRPPAPEWSKGIKRHKRSAAEKKTRSQRSATTPPDSEPDRLEIIQTSLRQIQSYLDTLAAVNASRDAQLPRTQAPLVIPPPRAFPVRSSSPATLADMLSVPQSGTKRYAHFDSPQSSLKN